MKNYEEGLKKWSSIKRSVELPTLSDYPTAGYEIQILGEPDDIYMEYSAKDVEIVKQLS